MDLLTNPKFMITTSYGILAMLIYTGVTIVILKNSASFKSSFFQLFCFGYFMYWMKFNWLIILSMFLIPFAFFTRHILQNHSFFNWSPTANFFIDTTYGRSNIYYFLMPTLILLTMINIVFNVLAGIRLYKMSKTGVRVPESSLFSMAFSVFLIDLFLTSLTVSNYYLTNMPTSLDSEIVRILIRWIPLLTPFASDALTLTHPILLLYFSKTVRRKCMESSKFLQKFHNHKFFAESNSGVVMVSAPRNLNNLVANSSLNRS
ncbi:hypothetical protein L3Y34_009976 [Caenorhabditis briggsae]|uniref:Serpentine receptor class gamma n=1 Tax=Caenorhabditis briggsae TaxID=6238 RepID=A0AAE9AA80_CAEBR|nr:hypothetical protein L3Y34_009976 [Caenorhabditis briggsae]